MTASQSGRKKDQGIAISSLMRIFHCPRQYYFQKGHEWKPSAEYLICKQVSCTDPDEEEDAIWESIILIEPEISEKTRFFLHSCLLAMKNTPVRSWTDLDIMVRSDRLGLYGQIDKYDARTGDCTLTRCSVAPKNGCWPEDAIRTAALLLCLEETYGINPAGLYIEYIRSGIIRHYTPTARDRRKIIELLHQFRNIEKGEFPPKPLKAPCVSCTFEKNCSGHQPRRLSSLFE